MTYRRRSAGSAAQRGYTYTHFKLRKAWAPQVAAGMVQCHAVTCLMPTRWIAPGSDWDLGHTPDRSQWTGPEHRKCSRSDGAVRGNRMRQRAARSREW